MNTNQFAHLNLSAPILKAISDEGYDQPTEVQQQAIPEVLSGRDLLATAQTGTGKTAAFCMPMLEMLCANGKTRTDHIRALVLTPTRELALQIDESLRTYGRYLRFRTAVILGGVSQAPQEKALRARPDFVVATPGRLLDLMQQGFVKLDRVEMLVLDEADRMLDMGFVRDVRRIVAATPRTRQTMFFSATLSPEIAIFAADMLRDPAKVMISPPASVSDSIEQKVLFVDSGNKARLLTEMLRDGDISRALVFTRTKHRADRISRQLSRDGILSDSIHGNKSQGARQRALAAFDRGRIRVLVATDVVARGIDVDGISHVINYELPNDPESYVHRIGRTARAGAHGIAISFCDTEEVKMLRGIEKLTQHPLTEVENHRFHAETVATIHERMSAPPRKPERSFGGRNSAASRSRSASRKRPRR